MDSSSQGRGRTLIEDLESKGLFLTLQGPTICNPLHASFESTLFSAKTLGLCIAWLVKVPNFDFRQFEVLLKSNQDSLTVLNSWAYELFEYIKEKVQSDTSLPKAYGLAIKSLHFSKKSNSQALTGEIVFNQVIKDQLNMVTNRLSDFETFLLILVNDPSEKKACAIAVYHSIVKNQVMIFDPTLGEITLFNDDKMTTDSLANAMSNLLVKHHKFTKGFFSVQSVARLKKERRVQFKFPQVSPVIPSDMDDDIDEPAF